MDIECYGEEKDCFAEIYVNGVSIPGLANSQVKSKVNGKTTLSIEGRLLEDREENELKIVQLRDGKLSIESFELSVVISKDN